jgi:PAS domain S-box-containing protein
MRVCIITEEEVLFKEGSNMAKPGHEWLCKSIVDNTPDAVIFADSDGIIRLWNSGAEAIFGYSAQEALGQSLDIIIPENLRGRHWEGYNKTMATGETKYGKDLLAVPGIRKDGTRISLEFSIVMVKDDEGKLLGPAAVLRDVTARWKKEKELKERLAALEGGSSKRAASSG